MLSPLSKFRKFFFLNMELLSSGQAVPTEAFNKSSSISSTLYAVLECHKILTKVRMEEEERMKLLNKLFEILGEVSSESMHQSEGEHPNPDKENEVGNVPHSEVSKLYSSLETADEKEENILMFLHNAVSKGAIVFKNSKLVLQSLRDLKLVKNADAVERLKKLSAEHEESCAVQQNKMELFGFSAEKESCLVNMEMQGPMVNNHRLKSLDAVTKEGSVTRGNVLSCTTGYQGIKDTTPTAGHVSSTHLEGPTPLCTADTSNKRDVQDTLAKKDPSFSGKLGEKGESSQLFQNSFNKEREKAFTKVTFSDIVKNDIQKPHVPCLFSNSVFSNNSTVLGSFSNEDSSLYRIDPLALERRMDLCSFSLVGKVTLVKGDSPWFLKNLKERIESIWNFKSAWRLISLGKGFFHILLNSKEEWDRAWSRGHLSLKPGFLRLQRWSVDFDPTKEKNSNAQVWFRIFNLPWCLWEPSVLAGIARKVGVPIRIDKATLESDLGHFARVLVDVDLSKSFRSTIHVEYGSHVFEVLLVAENVPLFCQSCHAIGHSSNECRLSTEKKSEPTKPSSQKTEKNENGKNKVRLELNESFNSVQHSSHAPMTNPYKRKKVMNAPVWKQKKVQAHRNESVSDHHLKPLNAIEMITDFGAQREILSTHDKCPNGIFSDNQFSILYDLDEIDDEENRDDNLFNEDNHTTSQIIDGKGTKQILAAVPHSNIIQDSLSENSVLGDIDCVSEIREGLIIDIPEKSIISDSVVDDFIPPKLPKRWEDILDEEEEIDKVPISRPLKSIAEIRENLNSLFMDRPAREMDIVEPDPHVFPEETCPTITPLSIKKDKKVKIGFRHTKGSSCSYKR